MLFGFRFGGDQNDSDSSGEGLKEDCNAVAFQDRLGVFTETDVFVSCELEELYVILHSVVCMTTACM